MPNNAKSSRIGMSRLVLRALLGATALGALCTSGDANAQIAGTHGATRSRTSCCSSTPRARWSACPTTRCRATTATRDRPLAAAPYNACAPGTASNPNRWGMLLQALTGNMQPYYSCDAVDRTERRVQERVQDQRQAGLRRRLLPAVPPAAHRRDGRHGVHVRSVLRSRRASPEPASARRARLAAAMPRDLPPDAFTEVYNDHLKTQYAAGSGRSRSPTNACTFEQANDGQLDAARDYVRFGLMTFDNDPDPGIGVAIARPAERHRRHREPVPRPVVVRQEREQHARLEHRYDARRSVCPAGCATGAYRRSRSVRATAAAPPWEGRMVPFPPANADTFDIEATNDAIQKVLLGTRPYGATPIDGMLEDARDYFWYNPAGPNGTAARPVRRRRLPRPVHHPPHGRRAEPRPPAELRGRRAVSARSTRRRQIADGHVEHGGARQARSTRTSSASPSTAPATSTFANDGFPTVAAPRQELQAVVRERRRHADGDARPHAPRRRRPSPAEGLDRRRVLRAQRDRLLRARTRPRRRPVLRRDAGRPRPRRSVASSAASRSRPRRARSRATRRAVTVAADSGSNRTASFIASFIPNAQKVVVRRDRPPALDLRRRDSRRRRRRTVLEGDSYAANLAAQTVAGEPALHLRRSRRRRRAARRRHGASTRPARFARTRPRRRSDGIPAIRRRRGRRHRRPASTARRQLGRRRSTSSPTSTASPRPASARGASTPCTPGEHRHPALSRSGSAPTVMWGFATGHSAARSSPPASTYDFNVRCSGASATSPRLTARSPAAAARSPIRTPALRRSASPVRSAFRSAPRSARSTAPRRSSSGRRTSTSATTPTGRSRQRTSSRRPTMYVASADGILHAFKALASQTLRQRRLRDVGVRSARGAPEDRGELPDRPADPARRHARREGHRLGSQAVATRSSANTYHTTLVAGMGAGGAGYYALNVSDADCGGHRHAARTAACAGKFTRRSASARLARRPRRRARTSSGSSPTSMDRRRPGEADAARRATARRSSRSSATRAARPRSRRSRSTRATATASARSASRSSPAASTARRSRAARARAHRWRRRLQPAQLRLQRSAPSRAARTFASGARRACATRPVPGRGVTIVRLDTGEIIRHFGRDAQDIPKRI